MENSSGPKDALLEAISDREPSLLVFPIDCREKGFPDSMAARDRWRCLTKTLSGDTRPLRNAAQQHN